MTLDVSETETIIPDKYFDENCIDDPTILKRTFEDHKVPLDVAFCRWMACEVGIAFIPGSSLYVGLKNARYDFVRISICKNEGIIEKVGEKLKNM
jgi:aspartate/methionine/tyrosine aminotransferase